VVSQVRHLGLTRGAAEAKRWPHVRRKVTERVVDELLVESHQLSAPCGGQGVERVMRISVRGDLVALCYHAAEDAGVGRFARVTEVEPVDEECGRGVVRCEQVQKLGRVEERAVVVGDGDGTFGGAVVDADSVGDTSELWTGDREDRLLATDWLFWLRYSSAAFAITETAEAGLASAAAVVVADAAPAPF